MLQQLTLIPWGPGTPGSCQSNLCWLFLFSCHVVSISLFTHTHWRTSRSALSLLLIIHRGTWSHGTRTSTLVLNISRWHTGVDTNPSSLFFLVFFFVWLSVVFFSYVNFWKSQLVQLHTSSKWCRQDGYVTQDWLVRAKQNKISQPAEYCWTLILIGSSGRLSGYTYCSVLL